MFALQGNGMQLKELKKKDISGCVDLFKEVFSLAPWNEEWTADQVIERLQCIADTPYYMGFSIQEGSNVLGFCMGNSEPYMSKKVFLLREMCVKPVLQGDGIGTMLLSHLEKSLLSQGINSIYLSTKPGSNTESFYLKHKYERNESESMYSKTIII